MPPLRISLIGLGTVGQGVVELINRHRAVYHARTGRELAVVAALVRDPSRLREHTPPGALVTNEPEAFFDEPSDIMVEVAGGIEPARSHIRRAIESGRDVVTANKALLAAHAPELFALAAAHHRRLLFEAAVAGGVPAIRLITDSLASGRIERFAGILNGTCNFILDGLSRGVTYEAALREAQHRGFAEADPTLDVSGDDSFQKLIILASLAFGRPIVPTSDRPIASSGITTVTPDDLAEARRQGGTIKLLAFARRTAENAVELFNGPMFVPDASPLSRVNGSEMGLALRTDSLSDLFMSGDGAGRFPTASAVVADILEAARLYDSRDAGPLNHYPHRSSPAVISTPDLKTTAGFATLPNL